jgi:hypothetical protein
MMKWLIVALLCLWASGAGAQNPVPPILYPCNGTAGTSASQVSFPAVGYTGSTPPSYPTSYFLIQNVSANDIWFNPLPGGTATQAAPSYHLVQTAGYVFSATDPVPSAVSVIASGASSAYACWYR